MVSYSTIISACGKGQQWQLALALLLEMPRKWQAIAGNKSKEARLHIIASGRKDLPRFLEVLERSWINATHQS